MQGCKNAPFEAHVVFVLDVNDSLGVSYIPRDVHVGRTVKRRVFVDAHVEINDLVKYPSRALTLVIRNAFIELNDNVLFVESRLR